MKLFNNSPYTPPIPQFTHATGKDGRLRLYLLASNRIDIEMICDLCGIFTEGIYYVHNDKYDMWSQIIKQHEKDLVDAVFPIYE